MPCVNCGSNLYRWNDEVPKLKESLVIKINTKNTRGKSIMLLSDH